MNKDKISISMFKDYIDYFMIDVSMGSLGMSQLVIGIKLMEKMKTINEMAQYIVFFAYIIPLIYAIGFINKKMPYKNKNTRVLSGIVRIGTFLLLWSMFEYVKIL